jgi:DNA-binding winged helix-turn-helix (wHTH) protein
MPDSGGNCLARRRPRRWSFGGCEFDEASWSLKAGGDRVAIETKPLELLRALLERAGNVVSKDELLDTIWPDVTVVEASLPTAVYKLRAALGDTAREPRIIETVSGLGYRISIPVEVADSPTTSVIPIAAAARHSASAAGLAAAGSFAAIPFERRKWASLRTLLLAGLVLGASTVLAPMLKPSLPKAQAGTTASFNQRDAGNALRRLDVDAIERMLAAGWNPNTPFDDQGNGAFGYLLNMCEWDHEHDRRRMLLMARTLIDGGANFHVRNVWGDTPYSIAKAERYCGPDHPVTLMLHRLCATGPRPLGDRCMASYEIARGARFDFSLK